MRQGVCLVYGKGGGVRYGAILPGIRGQDPAEITEPDGPSRVVRLLLRRDFRTSSTQGFPAPGRTCGVLALWRPVAKGPGCTTGLCPHPMQERRKSFGKRLTGFMRTGACRPTVRGSQELAAPRKSSSAYKVLPSLLRWSFRFSVRRSDDSSVARKAGPDLHSGRS